MGDRRFVPISVSGPLDTVNPVSNRGAGTLVEAVDTSTRWIGPRLGAVQFTGARERGVVFSPSYGAAVLSGDGLVPGGYLSIPESRSLSTRWTVDVLFNLERYVVGSVTQTLFVWRPYADPADPGNEREAFWIRVGGGSVPADEGRVFVTVKTTNGQGTPVSQYDMQSTRLISPGLGPENLSHVRLVRDRESLHLSVDGVHDTSLTTLGPSEQHVNDARQSPGDWFAGGHPSETTGSDVMFRGYLWSVALRTGAHYGLSDAWTPPRFPRTPAYRICLVSGADISLYDLSNDKTLGVIVPQPGPVDPPITQIPSSAAVQGVGSFTDNLGSSHNVVQAGGDWYTRLTTR